MPAETREFNLVPSARAITGGTIVAAGPWPLGVVGAGPEPLAAAEGRGGRGSHDPTGGTPATTAQLSVAIMGAGNVASESYLALQDAGLEVQLPRSGPQPPSSLTLICSDDGDPIALRKANAAALEVKRPFSFALVAAHVVRVGPLVVPGRSACYQCLASAGMTRQRKASRHGSYRAVAARMAGSFAAVQLHNFANRSSKQKALGEVITYDLRTNALVKETLDRDPGCPACGKKA
jgi:ribosomal protein S12 methylthiotransferase accessory factor